MLVNISKLGFYEYHLKCIIFSVSKKWVVVSCSTKHKELLYLVRNTNYLRFDN